MGALSELTLGDIGRGLARYRPVALTVGAILVAIVVLPKPDVSVADLADTLPGSSSSASAAAASSSSSDAAVVGGDGAGDAASSGDVTSVTSASSDVSFGSSSPSATFSSPSSSSSPGGADDVTSTPTTVGGSFEFAPSTSSQQPLRIVARSWASRTAGTPLADNGVTKGSLPVGTRAGQDDKLSFVRLSGDETVLRLHEVAPPGRASVQGPAAVAACQITAAGWSEGEAVAIADAPAYDATKCIEGVRKPEGFWEFDLSSFPSRSDERGFALRPGKGAGVDFQVEFTPS